MTRATAISAYLRSRSPRSALTAGPRLPQRNLPRHDCDRPLHPHLMVESADIFVDAGLVEGQRPTGAAPGGVADRARVEVLARIVDGRRLGGLKDLGVSDEQWIGIGLSLDGEDRRGRWNWNEGNGMGINRLPGHGVAHLDREVFGQKVEALSQVLAAVE